MSSSFDAAFSALMQNEGGFSNNPNDPGGATMWGVTEKVARAHGYTGEMADLPQSTARDIAQAEYWTPIHGDDLDPRLAFQLLDCAYNSGVAQAVKLLQRAVGVTADGVFGNGTLAAVRAYPSTDKLIMRYIASRLLFYTSLTTWGSFGKGWANRIANNLLRATS